MTTHWEYKAVEIIGDPKMEKGPDLALLNEIGQQGWEAWDIKWIGYKALDAEPAPWHNRYRVLLKRPFTLI